MEFICYSSLEELPTSADLLFESFEEKSVYFSKLWFKLIIDHGLDNEAVVFACVVENDEALAVLPLIEKESGHFRALSHLYTYLADVLVIESRQEEVLTCLAEGLNGMNAKSVWIEPADDTNDGLQTLASAMESQGFSLKTPFKFYNWIHRTGGQSFLEYMNDRPSRVRNTIDRKRRKLSREKSFRVEIFTKPEIKQGLTDYNRIYRASWKAFEQFSAFSDELARRLAAAGWLRLGILYIDDEPAAGQFWFVVHGKASIFKLAYDAKWKTYSPGSILIAELMRHAIDTDGVDEIDFLMGNDNYKQDWMSSRRSRCGYYFSKQQIDSDINNGFFARINKTLLSFR